MTEPSLAAAQEAIGYGDHWVRFGARVGLITDSEELSFSEEAPPIFGRVSHLTECYPEDVPGVERAFARGRLYGPCYSPWCPEGEHGETHRGAVVPITAEAFTEARRVGWDFEYLIRNGVGWAREALAKWTEARRERA